MRTRGADSHFISGGYERAVAALQPVIRQQVEAEYAAIWNASGPIRRWFLRRQIEEEIARRIEARAPADALY